MDSHQPSPYVLHSAVVSILLFYFCYYRHYIAVCLVTCINKKSNNIVGAINDRRWSLITGRRQWRRNVVIVGRGGAARRWRENGCASRVFQSVHSIRQYFLAYMPGTRSPVTNMVIGHRSFTHTDQQYDTNTYSRRIVNDELNNTFSTRELLFRRLSFGRLLRFFVVFKTYIPTVFLAHETLQQFDVFS